MKTPIVLTLGLLSFFVACGCGEASDTTPVQTEEDELGLHKGSVDHAAIVEVTTMMLAGTPTASVLDKYNREDPFAMKGSSYADVFAERLDEFDAYDGAMDWTAEQAAAWVARVAVGNYLVVDTSMPCNFAAPHTYLEIERAQMTGKPHTTCGGRMPNEDALDVTLNWLIRGPEASAEDADAIRDGVGHATRASADTFPYLAELNGI